MMIAGHVRRSQNETPTSFDQSATGVLLELAPKLVRAQDQRHELAAFADGLSRDAGVAVRGAVLVRRREAVDADDAQLPLGCMVERGAAHSTKAGNQDVAGSHRNGQPCPMTCAGQVTSKSPEGVLAIAHPECWLRTIPLLAVQVQAHFSVTRADPKLPQLT